VIQSFLDQIINVGFASGLSDYAGRMEDGK
jgi:hypothetical protein